MFIDFERNFFGLNDVEWFVGGMWFFDEFCFIVYFCFWNWDNFVVIYMDDFVGFNVDYGI